MTKKQDIMQRSHALLAGKSTRLRFTSYTRSSELHQFRKRNWITAYTAVYSLEQHLGTPFCSHTLSCSGRGKDTSIGQPSPTVLRATLSAAGPEQPLLTLFQNPFTLDFFKKSMCFFLSCKWNKVSMQWFNLSEPATILSIVSQKMNKNIVLASVLPRALNQFKKPKNFSNLQT